MTRESIGESPHRMQYVTSSGHANHLKTRAKSKGLLWTARAAFNHLNKDSEGVSCLQKKKNVPRAFIINTH